MTQVSRQELTQYTAFRDDDGTICFYAVQAASVADFMAMVGGFYYDWGPSLKLLAWAPEWPRQRGGRLECDDLCAESRAAGRLIELVDGKYVARGVPMEEAPKRVETLSFSFESAEEEKPIAGPDATLEQVMDAVADMHIANAAMIARDGPAKPLVSNWIDLSTGCGVGLSTAKPNPFQNFRSPDQCQGPADHLNASRHQMAVHKG